jgi:hypothetical protein
MLRFIADQVMVGADLSISDVRNIYPKVDPTEEMEVREEIL